MLIAINLMAIAALVAAYFAPFVNPREMWVPAIFGLAYPYILLINLIFIVWWIVNKSRMVIFSIIAILAGYSSLYTLFRIKPRKSEDKGIVVCSYNVKDFAGIDNKSDKKWNEIMIQDYLREQNPDIVCLQEIDSASITGFCPFPYKITPESCSYYSTRVDKTGNLIIFSRFPVIGEGKITFKDTPNMIVFADLKINNDTVRVYNCHLQSYQLHFSELMTTDLAKFHLFWSRVKTTIKKRAKQIDLFEKHIQGSPFPVIIIGDFNDSPVSHSYKKIMDDLNMTDSFLESGTGLCNTFKEWLFSFRVDYILHDQLFESYDFKVDRLNYSDHNPVICKLIKKDHIFTKDDE